MPRQPKLYKKVVNASEYRYTGAGGGAYFGRVDAISHKDAKKAFAAHLNRLQEERPANKVARLTWNG